MLTEEKPKQWKGSLYFPSCKDHNPELTTVQCLKTIVSNILSAFVVVVV